MGDNYIISARKRTGDALIAEPGPIKFLKVPDVLDSYDARQAVSSAKDWVAEVQGLADGDENPNSIGPRGDVLIFVHDRCRVGVDEDDAVAFLLQRLAGLGAGVVEFASLANDDRSCADDEDRFDILALRHAVSVRAAARQSQ